jgi:hypothetical protein
MSSSSNAAAGKFVFPLHVLVHRDVCEIWGRDKNPSLSVIGLWIRQLSRQQKLKCSIWNQSSNPFLSYGAECGLRRTRTPSDTENIMPPTQLRWAAGIIIINVIPSPWLRPGQATMTFLCMQTCTYTVTCFCWHFCPEFRPRCWLLCDFKFSDVTSQLSVTPEEVPNLPCVSVTWHKV